MITQIDDTTPVAKVPMEPRKMSLAMAYVPYQEWGDVYKVDLALARGTLFPELDKPFIGEEAVPHVRA